MKYRLLLSCALALSGAVAISANGGGIPSGDNCTWQSSPFWGSGYTQVFAPIGACQDKYKVVNTDTHKVEYMR